MLICDVCERIIEGIICPYCKFNNSEQIYELEDEDYSFVYRVIDEFWYLDEYELVDILCEMFGFTESQVRRIITEREYTEGFDRE